MAHSLIHKKHTSYNSPFKLDIPNKVLIYYQNLNKDLKQTNESYHVSDLFVMLSNIKHVTVSRYCSLTNEKLFCAMCSLS